MRIFCKNIGNTTSCTTSTEGGAFMDSKNYVKENTNGTNDTNTPGGSNKTNKSGSNAANTKNTKNAKDCR